jgi:hypothetical protein
MCMCVCARVRQTSLRVRVRLKTTTTKHYLLLVRHDHRSYVHKLHYRLHYTIHYLLLVWHDHRSDVHKLVVGADQLHVLCSGLAQPVPAGHCMRDVYTCTCDVHVLSFSAHLLCKERLVIEIDRYNLTVVVHGV